MTEERDPLHILLDEALAEYGRSEPRPGLEGRVLAALRSEPRPRWGSAFLRPAPARVAFAAAALLVLAAGTTLVLRSGSRRSVAPEQAVVPGGAPAAAESPSPSLPSPPPRAETDVASRAPRSTPVATASSRLTPERLVATGRVPRRSTFPAAAPLSEQEQLLLRFVVEAPREEVERRAGFLDEPARLPPLPDQNTEP